MHVDRSKPQVPLPSQIAATGTFTRTDGTTGTVADVWYKVDNSYTQYAGDPITITEHASELPDHKGHGTLVSLRPANDNGRQMQLLRAA
jgi:hypothetical protein